MPAQPTDNEHTKAKVKSLDSSIPSQNVRNEMNLAKRVLMAIFRAIIMTFVVFLLFIFVIALNLGGLWNPFIYGKILEVTLVNNDNGFVGSYLSTNLSTFCPYTISTMNISDPVQYVSDAKTWFLLHIPQGFSDRLTGALNGTISLYNGNIDFYVDEGRSYLVLLILEPLLTEAVKQASDNLMLQVLANSNLGQVKDYNVLLNPITVNKIVIHPNTYFGQDIASGFLNVFIFILSIVVTLLTTSVYASMLFTKINFVAYYAIKQAHNLFNAIVLSSTITVALLCFSSPFYISAGLYFIFYCMVILTVIQAVETLHYLLKQYTIIGALSFVVLNFTTSSALVMLEVQYPFFQIGRGLPMYNAVNGARYIMFGSDNRMGLYVGVIIIWLVICWAINLFLYIMTCLKLRRKQKKDIAKEIKDDSAGGIVEANDINLNGQDVELKVQPNYEPPEHLEP